MTTKTVSKFNDKQTAHMAQVYTALIAAKADDDTRRAAIQELADEFNMSTRSIIGKLSTMQNVTYQPYAGKKPSAPKVTNQMLVNDIAAAIGATADDLASLVRGSKKAIQLVHDALMVEQDAQPEGEDTPNEG